MPTIQLRDIPERITAARRMLRDVEAHVHNAIAISRGERPGGREQVNAQLHPAVTGLGLVASAMSESARALHKHIETTDVPRHVTGGEVCVVALISRQCPLSHEYTPASRLTPAERNLIRAARETLTEKED